MDATQSPLGNVVVDFGVPSVNTTVPTQTDNNATTAATNVSSVPERVVNMAEVIMENEYVLEGLGHFEQYMVEVVACTAQGCSDHSEVASGRTLPKGEQHRRWYSLIVLILSLMVFWDSDSVTARICSLMYFL